MANSTLIQSSTKANQDLRQELRTHGMPMWVLAETIGVSEMTVCRWLRKELPEEQKAKIRTFIEQIKEEY